MLNEKQIKRAVELADGFELIYRKSHNTVDLRFNNYSVGSGKEESLESLVTKSDYYYLLLYRAMEGWNKSKTLITDWLLRIDHEFAEVFIEYKNGETDVIKNYYIGSYTSTKYLTAQEQVLEKVLEEVL